MPEETQSAATGENVATEDTRSAYEKALDAEVAKQAAGAAETTEETVDEGEVARLAAEEEASAKEERANLPANLGRKVKKLEDAIANAATRDRDDIAAIREQMTALMEAFTKKSQEEVYVDPDEERQRELVREELTKAEKERVTAINAMTKEYNTSAWDTLKSLEEAIEDEDLANEIRLEMAKNNGDNEFNKRHPQHANLTAKEAAFKDISMNFAKAQAVVLKRKAGGKENPFNKNDGKEKPKTGMPGNGKTDIKVTQPARSVPEDVYKMWEGMGKTREWVNENVRAR